LARTETKIERLRVAIVHDWLDGMPEGKGAEQLCGYSIGDIYTLIG